MYTREFSRKEPISQRLLGGLLGVEEPPPRRNFSLTRSGGRLCSYLLRDGIRRREHAPAFHGRLLLRLDKRPVRHELQLVVLQTQPGVKSHGAREMQTVLGLFLPSQPYLGAGGDPYLDSS